MKKWFVDCFVRVEENMCLALVRFATETRRIYVENGNTVGPDLIGT
jgi:hypothetical protein